jgi:hypothetical protein
MFRTKAKKESSPTEMALARMDIKLDQISSLYEPLAMRVANLEAMARSALPELAQQHLERRGRVGRLRSDSVSEAGHPTGWLRILRHMWPSRVRRLLSEHDELERIRSNQAQPSSEPDDHRQGG